MPKEPKVKTEEEIEYPTLGWKKVEDYLSQKTPSSLILALLEAGKLLDYHLSHKGYPGKNLEEKIAFGRERFSNLQKLVEALRIKNEIISKINYKLTTLDLEEGISAFKQAIIDLEQSPKKLTLFDQAYLYFTYFFPQKLKSSRRLIIYIFLFFLAVWFFANTSLGRTISGAVVFLANWIFSWVFAIFLLILAAITIIVISILYFEKRRRQKE